MQFNNHQVDFLDEDVLTEPALLDRHAVVVVTEPSLPAEGQAGLAAYAARGGTVLLTRGAATRDRYGSPLAAGLGLAPGVDDGLPEAGSVIGNVWTLPLAGNGTVASAPERLAFEAWGSRGHAPVAARGASPAGVAPPPPPPGDALATFADGSPAIVSVAVGAGAVVRVLWLPGVSWIHSGWLSGASDVVLELISNASGLTDRLVSTTTPACRQAGGVERGIETPMLVSAGAAAVTLLNWCGENLTTTLTAELNFTVAEVRSAATGAALAFTQNKSSVVIPAIRLGAVDVITMRGH